jgi:hypothetical protein
MAPGVATCSRFSSRSPRTCTLLRVDSIRGDLLVGAHVILLTRWLYGAANVRLLSFASLSVGDTRLVQPGRQQHHGPDGGDDAVGPSITVFPESARHSPYRLRGRSLNFHCGYRGSPGATRAPRGGAGSSAGSISMIVSANRRRSWPRPSRCCSSSMRVIENCSFATVRRLWTKSSSAIQCRNKAASSMGPCSACLNSAKVLSVSASIFFISALTVVSASESRSLGSGTSLDL